MLELWALFNQPYLFFYTLKCQLITVSFPHFVIDVFKSALKLGTFSSIIVTYTASALLHVSMSQPTQ